MKKILYMLCVASVMILSGCASKESADESNNSIEVSSEETNSNQGTSNIGVTTNNINVDENIDLTKLNSTMLYARLTNIYDDPESYIGKTIKMKGQFSIATSNTTNQNYYYAMIYDELLCCQAGVEFIWDDNSHKYPEEYPAEGQEIEIEGEFSSYEENGDTYYYLNIKEIKVI